MDSTLNRTSLLWGVPGLIVQTIAYMVATNTRSPILALFFLLLTLVGTGLLLVGLAYYARAKGHSPWWCLAGLLSCIGIVVLAILPDRRKPEQHTLSIDELDLPDGTQSPFGSR